MPSRHHSILLGRLAADDLAALADYHRAISESFRVQADKKARLEALNPRKVALRRFDRLKQLGELAVELHAAGADLERATALIARQHDVGEETVLHHVARIRKELDGRERERRDRRIWIRAKRGWTNARIAKAEGVHPNTVTKALARMKKAAGRASVEMAARRRKQRGVTGDDDGSLSGGVSGQRHDHPCGQRRGSSDRSS